jgi:phage-related protein
MGPSFQLQYFSPRVRAEIESWPVDLLARCDELLDLLEDHGPQLKAPHSKPMGGGLFELRPKSRSGIGRALYCYCHGNVITILHAFVKTSQKTPRRDLAIARQRLKQVKDHG